MKQLKKNFEQHKIVYLIILLILLIFTGMFFLNRYAVDTYYLEAFGYKNNAINPYLKDGRLFMTAFLEIMGLFNISFSTMKIISWLLAISSLYISMILIYNTLQRFIKKKQVLKILISFGLVFNIFVSEFFMFPEYTGVMCLGILFSTISAYFLVSYFDNKERRNLAFAYISAFLTAFCYQGCLSLLVLFPIVFTLKYTKNIKEFIVNNGLIAVGYAIPSITTLIVSKMLGSSRVSGGLDLATSFSKLKDGLNQLLTTTFQILPKGVFLILTMLAIIIVVYALIKNRESIYKHLFFIYLMLAVVIVTLVPHILVNPESIWLVPRSNIGLGLLFIMPIVFYTLYVKENHYINNIVIILLVILFVFHFVGLTKWLDYQHKNNILDYKEALEIKSKVEEYEKNHDLITHVAVYSSPTPVFQHPGIVASGDINLRTYSIDWSARAITNFILKRSLKDGQQNEKIKLECEEKMKNNEKRNYVIFDKATVHICTY